MVDVLNHIECNTDRRECTLDDSLYVNALSWMWRSRYVNKFANTLQRNGGLYIWLSSVGQEAAQVGVGLALSETDYVFPSYREHVIPLIRGVEIPGLVSIFSGDSKGGWDPGQHNCHIYTLVLGSQVLHSTGFAMSLARDCAHGKSGRRVVTFLGDGASTQGAVHEGFVFAASQNTQQLFIIQDNGWAISTPTHVQSPVPLVRRGFGYGMPSLEVDGNDFDAVYHATRQLLEDRHSGPRLLVLKTYRIEGHATTDSPSVYRSRQEVEKWQKQKDPIANLEKKLLGRLGADVLAEIKDSALKWVEKGFERLYENANSTS